MKINQILIFISTAVVLYSILSSKTVDAWVFAGRLCWKDSDCHDSEICDNFKCFHACAKKNCPATKACQVSNHIATCLYPSDYVLNSTSNECIKSKTCSTNNDCTISEVCRNEVCTNMFTELNPCAENEGYQIMNDTATCQCFAGYGRNITSGKCQKEHCVTDKDCKDQRSYCVTPREYGIRQCCCIPNHDEINGTCQRNCTDASGCNVNEFCSNGTCKCNAEYPWNNFNKQCRRPGQ